MKHKAEQMFSKTLRELRYCYENIDFALETVCSTAGAEHEYDCRDRLIQLCIKVAAEHGHIVADMPS